MLVIVLTVFLAALAGLLWAHHNYKKVADITVSTSIGLSEDDENKMEAMSVAEIGMIIRDGASQFIESEYKACSVFIILMGLIVFGCVDKWGAPYTTFAFILGAVTSMICGGFGMRIATFANYRTTSCAKTSLGFAFKTAFRAGCVIGFTLVSLAMAILLVLILVYKHLLSLEA